VNMKSINRGACLKLHASIKNINRDGHRNPLPLLIIYREGHTNATI